MSLKPRSLEIAMIQTVSNRIAVSKRTALRLAALLLTGLLVASATPAAAAPRNSFKLAWSIYTGYMPWAYAEQSGILKKWADKYRIKIELVQVNDYIESINQYTAGQFDAVTATTMDAFTIPAVGGVDTTVLILGDYSNGNDAIVLKGKGKTLKDLKGATVNLVQYSVSHYMLDRALSIAGLAPSDVKVQNISDADFLAAFKTPDVKAVAAWNPALAQIEELPDISIVFQSTQIPGELLDIAVANTAVLRENPDFGKAMVGAWFEVLAAMRSENSAARKFMASASGTTLENFDAQVKTTRFYADPGEAAAFMRTAEMAANMNRVRTFCFEQKLMGASATSKDAIGIELTGKTILGDPANVKLRLDDSYMQLAADGKL
jgi:NitT/TauT family transport system substrate-binding protein